MRKPFDHLMRRIAGVDRDLARLADPAAAEALWHRAIREASSISPTVRVALVSFFFSIILMGLVLPFWRYLVPALGKLASASEFLVGMIFALLFGALSGLGFVTFRRRRLQHDVWRRLVEHGLPTCVHCGYDLTSLTASRCPECGAAAPAPPPPPLQ